MTILNDRQKAFENEFAHKLDLEFKCSARAYIKLGKWVSQELNHNNDEATSYKNKIISLIPESNEKIIEIIFKDLSNSNLQYSMEEIVKKREYFLEQAKNEIIG